MTVSVNIRKTLGALTIDAWFESAGGVTALFGKSGAGKTSIVQMLAGLMTPDNGQIAIDGTPVFDSATGLNMAPEHRQVGYVFQDARLFPHMNVRRNLEYGRRRNRKRNGTGAKFDDVVDVLAIAPLLDRQPHLLSGGEKQRVALGRALLSAPRLLLMDEPLAALDAERKWEVLPFIDRIQRDFGTPVVYVSHSIEEILQIADTMVLIANGGVSAAGPVEDVLNRPDLLRAAGDGNAGSVITVRVADIDLSYGIATLAFAGGEFRVTAPDLTIGESLRIRVRARDVTLATERPQNVSVLNVFEGTVSTISTTHGPQVDVSVDVGGAVIWSQITRKSLDDLALQPGARVFTMVKAVAIDRPAASAL
ncbi:MAG: molybdate transport system ATP-binding protein [Paracoccaceae bacterium]|jgi:molybdate transport system ATP-binding protein